MSTPPAMTIGAEGIDVDHIVADLQARVAEKRRQGAYNEARIARAEKHNLLNLKDDDEFLDHYLACLRQIVQVDINDFEIFERRARLAPFLVRIKQGIWKLLRFYTYRLWSQQNETNALLLAALEMLNNRNANRIGELEERLAELEKQLPGTQG